MITLRTIFICGHCCPVVGFRLGLGDATEGGLWRSGALIKALDRPSASVWYDVSTYILESGSFTLFLFSFFTSR